jgi:hypothetical protein
MTIARAPSGSLDRIGSPDAACDTTSSPRPVHQGQFVKNHFAKTTRHKKSNE